MEGEQSYLSSWIWLGGLLLAYPVRGRQELMYRPGAGHAAGPDTFVDAGC